MSKKVPDWAVKILVATLTAILIVLIYQIWRQYQHLERVNVISTARMELDELRHRGPLTAADTSYVQSWMTFDYIGMIYRVPTAMFMTDLHIMDQRYPRVTLYRYARNNNLDPAVLTDEVRNAVRDYLVSSTPSTATSTLPSSSVR